VSEQVEPLTFTKFLEFITKAHQESVERPTRAYTNGRTLSLLLDSAEFRGFPRGEGTCLIYGIEMGIDEQLPDNAIRIGDKIYNAAKVNDTSGEAMDKLQTSKGITRSEVQQISNAILAMANPRDTQFLGFAKLQLKKMLSVSGGGPGFGYIELYEHGNISSPEQIAKYERLIAQCAYVLVCHAVEHVSECQAAEREVEMASAESIVQDIPDMTEWPKEQSQEENIATALEKFLTDPRYTNKDKQERIKRTIQALLEEGNIIMDIPLVTEWLKQDSNERF
jgi:hypothetical protein